VKQQSKAVLVQSPLQLAEHIETLIGTSSLAARIAEVTQQAQQQARDRDALDAAMEK
jgi:hypothetical protein